MEADQSSGATFSSIVAQLPWVSPATWIALIALAMAIHVVEIGVREAAYGAGVVMPVPGWATGVLERVRSVRLAHMPDAQSRRGRQRSDLRAHGARQRR